MIEVHSVPKLETPITTAADSAASRQHDAPHSSRGSIPKTLRRAMTPAQRSFLVGARRHPRLHGKFAWLQWIGRDLVDFICHVSRLVIVIEPAPQVTASAPDARDARLRRLGFKVLHFSADAVLRDLHATLEQVSQRIDPLPATASTGAKDAPTNPDVTRVRSAHAPRLAPKNGVGATSGK